MSEEIWKDIKGYEGLYQVSNLGKVRSLQYNKQKILKIGYTNKGYGSINLCKKGKISHRNVHRLVAETFIPNPNKYFCVNHKDENPRNNNADNLEWCTIQYNNQYGTCAKRRNQNNKIPIKQYDKSNNFIKTWESAIDIQNQIGINQGSIIACCRNKLKTAGGYIWRYKENNITQKTKKQLMQEINQLIIQLAQEKEKNKTLEELLQGRLFELYNYYKDLAGSYQANCISKDKIRNILGLDSTETEETILQYIQTLESENARLEDIENKKVQIEYELVFNKGVNSIKDKINAKIYQLNNTDILEDQIAITYLKELLNKEE